MPPVEEACGHAQAARLTAKATGHARQATAKACSPAREMVNHPTRLLNSRSTSTTTTVSSASPSTRASMYPWSSCQCRSRDKEDQGAERGPTVGPTSRHSVRASSRHREAATAHVQCSRSRIIICTAAREIVNPTNTRPSLCGCARRQ